MSQESPIWGRAREQGRRRGRKEASSGCGSCSATSAFSLLWCLWWWSSSCRKFRSGRWSDSPDLSAPSQLWSTCHLAVKPCPFHVLVLLLSPIFTKFWLQGKNWIYQPPYFIKNFISTNRSRVNDPPILAQKQQKMAIFDKTDFWGLKHPLEVRVQSETCSTICGTPVPAILNPKNSTGLAGGAKKSQNWVFLKLPNIATLQEKNPKKRFFSEIPQDF